jgi:hypothetical protein
MIKAGDEVFTYQGIPTKVTLTQQYNPPETAVVSKAIGSSVPEGAPEGTPAAVRTVTNGPAVPSA